MIFYTDLNTIISTFRIIFEKFSNYKFVSFKYFFLNFEMKGKMGQRKLPPWFGEPVLPSFGLRGYQRGNHSVGRYSRSSKVRVLRRKQTYTGWDKNLKQNQWHTKWPIAYRVWDTNIILMKIWHMFTELFIQRTFTFTVQLHILYKISSTCICNSQDSILSAVCT